MQHTRCAVASMPTKPQNVKDGINNCVRLLDDGFFI